MLTVIDQATETIAWELPTSAGVRPMTFDTRPDGSTKNIYIQLSDYHGFAVIDFDARKEVRRIDMPEIKGEEKHTTGLQGAPAHGLGVTPDGKVLFSTSKVYSTMYAYSLPNLEPLGARPCRTASGMGDVFARRPACLRGGGRGQLDHCRGTSNAESRCKHSSWAGSEAERHRHLAPVKGTCHIFT